MRRFLKGLPLREWIAADDLDNEDEEEAPVTPANDDSSLAADDSTADNSEEEEEADPMLLESGRILADFMSLNEPRLSRLDNLPEQRRQ